MKLKNRHFLLTAITISFLAFSLVSTTSCSRKSGCPAEDAMIKTDKNGNLKAGKTNSGLFPTKGRKRNK